MKEKERLNSHLFWRQYVYFVSTWFNEWSTSIQYSESSDILRDKSKISMYFPSGDRDLEHDTQQLDSRDGEGLLACWEDLTDDIVKVWNVVDDSMEEDPGYVLEDLADVLYTVRRMIFNGENLFLLTKIYVKLTSQETL